MFTSSVLSDLRSIVRHAGGVAVTFTRTIQSYDKTTDSSTATDETLSGTAVRVQGDPEAYEALELKRAQAITLEFVPDEEGDVPALGSSVEFGGAAYTVRSVQSSAPGGSAARSRVVAAR